MFELRDGEILVSVDYATPHLKLGDGVAGTWFFAAWPDVDVLEVMKASFLHALETEGSDAIVGITGVFPEDCTWGDILNVVADTDDFGRRGVRFLPLPLSSGTCVVDHDETPLWSDLWNQRMDAENGEDDDDNDDDHEAEPLDA